MFGAIQMVERADRKQGLTNVRRATGLGPETIDVAFLFDTLHDVRDKKSVLGELRRVLKPKGRLLYKDHTLNGVPLREMMVQSGFRLVNESGCHRS